MPAFGPESFPALFIALFALVLVGAIVGWIWHKKREQERSRRLGAWARHHGFHFLPRSSGKDSSIDQRFPAFDCLRKGDDRYAYNLARGEHEGREVWAFDYHYRTRSTDSKGRTQYHHHHFSAVVVHSGMALRPLVIRPEHWWDKLKSVFGFDDIDFESAEFSRKFHVSSPDRKWAYDVIHTATMELLLRAPRYSIHMAGPHVIAWRGRRLRAAQFDHALRLLDGLLQRIPRDIRESIRL